MPNEPNIVLVHGFWGGAAHWGKVIAGWPEKGINPSAQSKCR